LLIAAFRITAHTSTIWRVRSALTDDIIRTASTAHLLWLQTELHKNQVASVVAVTSAAQKPVLPVAVLRT
jgi:hypothetical protein